MGWASLRRSRWRHAPWDPRCDGRAEYHYVLMDYICRPAGGTLQAADDASRAAWVTEAELDGMKITEGTPEFIVKAFDWLRARA